MPSPLLIVFCGPNGAGKSTLRQLLFADMPGLPFVNADEIAKREFGPDAETRSYEAAQLAADIRQRYLDSRDSFSFETILSDPVGEKVDFLREARRCGYEVHVHFVGLDSAVRSQARVVQRVFEGGHQVPHEKLGGRYERILTNLQRLLPIPDELHIYDNSSSEDPYRLLAVLHRGQLTKAVSHFPQWLDSVDLESLRTPNTLLLS